MSPKLTLIAVMQVAGELCEGKVVVIVNVASACGLVLLLQ
jgi:glutathione peroxidase-family protein